MPGYRNYIICVIPILLFGFFLIVIPGCSSKESSRKTESKSVVEDSLTLQNLDSTNRVDSLMIDTLRGDEPVAHTTVNDSNQVENKMVPPPSMPDLAPGTVHLQIKVKEISKKEGGEILLEAEAVEVYGYGSATPPVAPGAKLTVDCTTYFGNSGKYSSSDLTSKAVSVILSSQPVPQFGEEKSGKTIKWTLARILTIN